MSVFHCFIFYHVHCLSSCQTDANDWSVPFFFSAHTNTNIYTYIEHQHLAYSERHCLVFFLLSLFLLLSFSLNKLIFSCAFLRYVDPLYCMNFPAFAVCLTSMADAVTWSVILIFSLVAALKFHLHFWGDDGGGDVQTVLLSTHSTSCSGTEKAEN